MFNIDYDIMVWTIMSCFYYSFDIIYDIIHDMNYDIRGQTYDIGVCWLGVDFLKSITYLWYQIPYQNYDLLR